MRIRVRHIVVAAAVATALFFFYALSLRGPDGLPHDYADGLAPPMDVPIEEAPLIELETTDLDLGVIPNDRDTETQVTVYNRGKSLLEIRDVRSACPLCTRGYFNPGAHRIAPGQSSPLNIVVSPAGIHEFHSVKTLTIMGNDPRNPQLQLRVEAHVDPEYELEPGFFDFGEVQKSERAQRVIRFRNRFEPPVVIKGVSLNWEEPAQAETPPISFSVEELPETDWREPGKTEYDITATLAPELRSGPFDLFVFIHTSLERFSPHRIAARGEIIAPYVVQLEQDGATLTLRGNDGGVITIHADQAIAVREPHAEQGTVAIQQHRDSAERHRLRCVPAETLERGIYHDHIRFEVEVDGVLYAERIPVAVYSHGSRSEEP